MNVEKKAHSQHIPVMMEEVLRYLQPRPGGYYIDGTVGGGGHTAALLERSAPNGRVLGIDTDAKALARVKARLADEVERGRLVLAHGNFAELSQIATDTGFTKVQGILLDLGFSSDQMDDPLRGFAFGADGPLDMRLNQSLELSAQELVNTLSERELADTLWRYGEETRSRQIARRIVREREHAPITRTAQLASIASSGVPFRAGAIHPATRTFQALRIAVNGELEKLEAVLPQAMNLLTRESGGEEVAEVAGRLVIIAFHSLEDRIVKEFLRYEARDCICPPRTPVCICDHRARLRILTSRPVVPTEKEIEMNPRARSAKLRAAEAIE